MAAASAGRGGFGEAGEGGAGKERGGSREAHHEAAPLPRSAVDRLDDVDHLLLVVDRPVDFVVVARPQVNHDVLRGGGRRGGEERAAPAGSVVAGGAVAGGGATPGAPCFYRRT